MHKLSEGRNQVYSQPHAECCSEQTARLCVDTSASIINLRSLF